MMNTLQGISASAACMDKSLVFPARRHDDECRAFASGACDKPIDRNRHAVCWARSLKARAALVLKILLADDNADRSAALIKVLSVDPGLIILRPRSGQLLADAVGEFGPDIVVVDMARPDRDALDGIRVLTATRPKPIALFVDHDDPAFMEDAISAGVSSYNVIDVPPPDVKPILRAAAAMFRQHQAARKGLREAEARLAERATIDRAKAILIKERRMAEPDAYRWLRKRAMESGRRIPDIAQDVIKDKQA